MKTKLHVFMLLTLCTMQSVAGVDPSEFANVVRTTDPLTPEREQQTFVLPPGFEIQLVAAEPDIAKPLNMAFDHRGRLWVTSSKEYPFPAAPNQQGRDTIKILEDTNNDGRADKIITFADGLNIPMGLYPYKDGVICFSIPNIWFLRDTDGDGQADRREKLFGPFGYERDTHGLCNAFIRGYDGWLYACHGFNNQSTVAGRDGHEITMRSGNTFRMRVDGSRIEQYTHGQVNPFGMAIDPRGDLFTADCHTKPITLLLQGGYYESFGKPHDGLGFVPALMKHMHGSTAIGGIAIYNGTTFPAPYRGNAFAGNVMTCRINRNSLQYKNATVQAHAEADFLASSDPWFRPVDLQVGPDGALYVADFYNRIIGHYEVGLDHPGRDRHRGRIWKIIYTGKDGSQASLKQLPPPNALASWMKELDSPNLARRMLAADQIIDRFGEQSVKSVRTGLHTSSSPRVRTHSLWILFRLDQVTASDLQRAVSDPSPQVRTHAQRLLGEMETPAEKQSQWLIGGLNDSRPLVQRAAVMASAQRPSADFIHPLIELLHRTPPADVHLRYATRMAIRNHLRNEPWFRSLSETTLSNKDAGLVANLCLSLQNKAAGQYLVQHIQQSSSLQRKQLSLYVAAAATQASLESIPDLVHTLQTRSREDLGWQQQLLDSLQTGVDRRGAKSPPAVRAWALSLATSSLAGSDQDRRQAALIAGRFGLGELRDPLVQLLRKPGTNRETSTQIAMTLATMNGDSRLSALAVSLSVAAIPPKLREKIVDAIIRKDPAATEELIGNALKLATTLEQLPVAEQLASDKKGVTLLLATVESGRAAAVLLTRPTVQARLKAIADSSQQQRLVTLVKQIPNEDRQLVRLIRDSKHRYQAAGGAKKTGAELFRKQCANCHQVSGQGKKVGPNLDGIGGRGLDRLLEDLLTPNRNVDVAFRSTTIVTNNGKVFSGLVTRTEGAQLILVDSKGKQFSIPTASIDERHKSVLSPMPANLAETLKPQELQDLLAYLLSLGGSVKP